MAYDLVNPEDDLGFAGPDRPLVVRGAAVLARRLAALMPDWPAAAVPAGSAADIVVTAAAEGFHLSTAAYPAEHDFDGPLAAANGLVGALIGSYVARDTALLCLHAAAITDSAGRLIVLLGDTGAGKSTLAVALAQRGRPLVADDRLAVRHAAAEGFGFGLVPKLRRPLPDEADAAFRAFVAARAGEAEGDMQYVLLRAPERGAFGVARPIAAILLLDRVPGAAPARTPLVRADLVRALVGATFAPQLDAAARLSAIAALAARLPAARLHYGSSFAAADFLLREPVA